MSPALHRIAERAGSNRTAPGARSRWPAAGLTLGTSPWLIAQSSRYQDLSHRFQQGGSDISVWHLAAIGIGVLLAVGLLAWIARRIAIHDGHGYRSPRRLFRDLCRLHELDWPARRLLGRLAREQGLPHRAHVFVRPETFAGDQLPPSLQPVRNQIEAIGEKLFGKPNANRESAETDGRTPDAEARSV